MIAVARGDGARVGEARVIIMVCIPERMCVCGAAAGAASTLA